MPRFVGLGQSNFDPERYRRECCDNHGDTLTTQGVLDGLKAVDNLLSGPNDWLAGLKETAYYISGPHDGHAAG